jgi:hypothetical protein
VFLPRNPIPLLFLVLVPRFFLILHLLPTQDKEMHPHGHLDVAPIGGKCLVFLSGAMDHEVQPSFADRVALTTWFM